MPAKPRMHILSSARGLQCAALLLLASLTACTTISYPAPNIPLARFAYAANSADNTISMYTVNTDGTWSPTLPATVPTPQPGNLTVDSSGRFLYVANESQNTISAFVIDPKLGTLSPATPATVATVPTGYYFGLSEQIAIDPSGTFLYTAKDLNRLVYVYKIDQSTGGLTLVSAANLYGDDVTGIGFDPSGRFAYIVETYTHLSMYTRDAVTGALTPNSPPNLNTDTYGQNLAMDPAGTFAFVSDQLSADVSTYKIDTPSGLLHLASRNTVGLGHTITSIAVDPYGKFLYISSPQDNFVTTYTIAPGTGVLTVLPTPVPTGKYPFQVIVDPSGGFAYVANQGSQSVSSYRITAATGLLVPTGDIPTGNGPAGIAIATTPRHIGTQ